MVFQKLTRLRKVELALKNTDRNENIKTAMDDYETMVGNVYGTFTTKLDAFHRDMERGGLINIMVESALSGRELPATIELFRKEHSRHFTETEGDADSLYRQMRRSFAQTMRELTKDRVLFDCVKAISKDIVSRLDQMEGALRSSLVPDAVIIDAETLNRAILKIAKSQVQRFKEIRVETVRNGARSVEIGKIYIPGKLRVRPTDRNDKRLAIFMDAMKNNSETSLLALMKNRSAVEGHESNEVLATITYSDFRTSFQRTVVLGDPGGGKSTICQKLCYDLAKAASLDLNHAHREINRQGQKIPIRVVLRQFEQARSSDAQLDLFTYISKDLLHGLSMELSEIRGILLSLFDSGRAVFAFDGLDEILDTSQRRTFVDLVTQFCDKYPLCPVVVTSRLVGYDDASLGDGFEQLILKKFDDTEVSNYLKGFLQTIGEKDKKQAEIEAARFIEQTNQNAMDLRRNPLLLGLMAFLFHNKGDVPSNRPEIYKECATLMFDMWDSRRGINANIPADFERTELFSEIAAAIYGKPEFAGGVSRTWLQESIRVFFQTLYLDRARSIQSAKSLVEFIVGRAWVMSEVGDDVFSFTHQTFLEYFFARHIDVSNDSVLQVLKMLRPRIVRHEWNEVTHLSLQLKTHSHIRNQLDALKWLVVEIVKLKRSKARDALVLFSAVSLEYLNGSEETVETLVSTIFEVCLENGKANTLSPILPLSIAYRGSSHRKDFVGKELVRHCSSTIMGNDEPAARFIASTVILGGPDFYHASLQRLPKGISAEVVASSRTHVLEVSGTSPFYSSLAWQWYGMFDEETFRKNGLQSYLEPFGTFTDIDVLSSLVLASSDRFGATFPLENAPPVARRAFLTALARFGVSDGPYSAKGIQATVRRFFMPSELILSVAEENNLSVEEKLGLMFIYKLINGVELLGPSKPQQISVGGSKITAGEKEQRITRKLSSSIKQTGLTGYGDLLDVLEGRNMLVAA